MKKAVIRILNEDESIEDAKTEVKEFMDDEAESQAVRALAEERGLSLKDAWITYLMERDAH